MKRLFLSLITAMMFAACGTSHSEVPERPGEKPEVSSELADGSMRISGAPLTLRYDDGGILFSRDSRGVIRGIRLADECRFEFDPSVPSLKINGVAVVLAGVALVQEKDGVSWYRLDPTGSDGPIYIVVAGL